MSAITIKDTERASPASANEEIRTSPPATLTPRPTPEEFLAALDLNPPRGLARAYVDTLITSALGEENLAFLKTKAHDEGVSGSDLAHILVLATTMARDADQRYAILSLHESYRTVLDFEGRLGEPRVSHPAHDRGEVSETTVTRGDSVQLLRSSIHYLAQTIETRAGALSALREEIALARAVVPEAPTHSPIAVQLQPAIPISPATTEESTSPAIVTDVARSLTKRFGSLMINFSPLTGVLRYGQRFLATLQAKVRSQLDESREAARGSSLLRSGLAKIAKAFRPLFELDIRGALFARAEAALGTLSPRGARGRYAQTGSSQSSENGAEMDADARDALFRFLLDFGKIKSYFKQNRQVTGIEKSFFIQEAQVVTDHEGRLERLDTFLRRTPEGRALFDVVYQPVSVPSTLRKDPNEFASQVTIPLAPGCETALPLPPNYHITGMAFLDSNGDRIDQPERHLLRTCIAGGALVTPPLDARMVSYSVKKCGTRPPAQTDDYLGPRALTAEEFEKLRFVLPSITFDLGEEMEIAYLMVRLFGDPYERASLAGSIEKERGWIYTMDSTVREFQRASGNAFLESVYHMRAGICDSMSAVGAYLIGNAIGLPGLVVSGPTQKRGYFDLKVGHSIAENLLPNGTITLDITQISHESYHHTGGRVPVSTQRTLSHALSVPGTTRREVAAIYQDIGDLVRGDTPERYLDNSAVSAKPLPTWRDRLLTKNTTHANRNSDNTPECPLGSSEDVVSYGSAVTLFDRIVRRSAERGHAGELCWFIRTKLPQVPTAPIVSPEGAQDRNLHPFALTLLERDLEEESAHHLVAAIHNHTIPAHEMARLPETIKSLSFEPSLDIAEALVGVGEDLEVAAEISKRLIKKALNTINWELRHDVFDQVPSVCDRIRTLTLSLHSTGHLTHQPEFATAIEELFEAVRYSKDTGTSERAKGINTALLGLLSAVWRVAGDRAAPQFCTLISENDAVNKGFDLMRANSLNELRHAIGVDTPEGVHALIAAFVSHLSTPSATASQGLRLLDRLETTIEHLDLAPFASMIRRLAPALIQRHIDTHTIGYRVSDRFFINWPSDENPASSLIHIANPKGNGGPCIKLLQGLNRLGALTEAEAKSCWPAQDEEKIVGEFVGEIRLGRGGVLIGLGDYHWNLGAMPQVLAAICETSTNPHIATIMRELVEWRKSGGEAAPVDDERHFQKILAMVGGVPDRWRAEVNTEAVAEALATFIQGTLTNQEFYRALHVLGPRVIPPSDKALDPEFSKNLSELARSLRGAATSAEAVEILQSARTFTKRRPMEVVPDVPGIAAACSILDIAHKLGVSRQLLGRVSSQWDPISHVTLNGRDDGSLPDGQVWRNALGVSESASPPALEVVTASIKLLREAFSSLPLAARQKLRSPLYQYTSSELGRVRIVGNSGSPEATRAYQPGDSRREINWRISGRDGQDKLWMKVREEREERSLTLVVDLTNLRADLRRYENADNRSAQTVIEKAPTLSTIVHETMVAHKAGLTVDILFTHHAVILSKQDAAEFILNPSKDKASREFWESVLLKSARASERHDDEVRIFGLQGFDSGSPLKYGEVPLRRNSFVQFLLGSNSAREGARTAGALKARGHLVSYGVLPGLRRGGAE